MDTMQLKTLIRQELPTIFRTDPDIHQFVLDLTKNRFAGKQETESRFDKTLAEIKAMREEQNRKWEESKQEDNRKWEEQDRRWEEQDRKWEEQDRKWKEQDRKWKENKQEHKAILKSIEHLARRQDNDFKAIGARWGLRTERSFRNGLRAILEETFGVTVENYEERDEAGFVFGRPEQVELDVIIKNGLLILCEIKSSMSKGDLYHFDKKITFYENRHNQKADRKIVISPMVRERAIAVATELGIELYTHAEDVGT